MSPQRRIHAIVNRDMKVERMLGQSGA